MDKPLHQFPCQILPVHHGYEFVLALESDTTPPVLRPGALL